MEQDIDQRHGERIIRSDGSIRFYRQIYKHPNLMEFIGYPVIVRGYGYYAVDVYLIERKIKQKWGRGKFLCMIKLVYKNK